ncbi:MAG: DUF1156 domain-containing protein, partial [Candidatus Bathyarchaeia archaeon]
TPLVGNWWLARVKAGEGYARLAWMEPVIEGEEVKIRVVDLNRELGDRAVKKAKVSGLRIVADGKELSIPESNIEARREKAVCLLCHQPIMQVDPQTGRHYTDTKNLPKEVKERLEGYVKYAIKTYNQGLEQEGVTPIARQKLLVKVKLKNGDLEFEPCTLKDQEKLELARKEVEKMLQENDPDIPREKIAPYGTQAIGGYLQPLNYFVTEWYKLFNPRQLLTLVKLVKLIREAGKKIEEEQTMEEAQRYEEAVVTCLATALCKYADFNSCTTRWNPGWLKFEESLSVRGIAMMWSWTDTSPFSRFTGVWLKNLENLKDGLSFNTLISSRQQIIIELDDATILSKLSSNENSDLIVTDPPYYDDVPYAELSDFYYVWLKRALSQVENGRLVPRF